MASFHHFASNRLSALPDAKPIEFCNGTVSDEVDGFTQWAVTQTAQSLAYATTSFNYKNPQHNYSVRSDLGDSAITYTHDATTPPPQAYGPGTCMWRRQSSHHRRSVHR